VHPKYALGALNMKEEEEEEEEGKAISSLVHYFCIPLF
jgi:hypothetical protein